MMPKVRCAQTPTAPSDYAKGVLSKTFLKRIFEHCKKTNKVVLVDPKGQDYSCYRGATLITPNFKECELASQTHIKNDKDLKSNSHYSKQYCEYPWLSLTVMADGNVVPCTQISNNELVLGNINENSLEEIWNGDKYQELRRMHVSGKFPGVWDRLSG